MPRSKREYLRRYADQALNDLDRAVEKFGQLRNEYIDGSPLPAEELDVMRSDITVEPSGPYKDHIQAWTTIIQMMLQIREFVQSMRDKQI